MVAELRASLPGHERGIAEFRKHANGFKDATFAATFDPPTVLSLLSRLSAAAERERELVEALRPFANSWAECEMKTPNHMPQLQDLARFVMSTDFRNAARALQAKEPT
jgi:hypothetical protein